LKKSLAIDNFCLLKKYKMTALKFKHNCLFYLDQTQLPLKEAWRQCRSLEDGFQAIKKLKVRGAPLIGVFAAYCICVHLQNLPQQKNKFLKKIKYSLKYLKSCRPTAVNLSWALSRLKKIIDINQKQGLAEIKKAILKEAKRIHNEDIQLCNKMADFGIQLISKGDRVLTHCNAGFLATSGEGTALAVIYKAKKVYGNISVYMDETRPLLQGARLTAWEMLKKKVPAVLICDNMAAHFMQKGCIDKIFVGADRIAANGDTANKIGTYSLAVLARYHKIPFYIVAPFSTFDLNLSTGKSIPIEQREPSEVKVIMNKLQIAHHKVKALNPAFDVTPHKLITAIVSDRGIIYPPFNKNIAKVIKGS